MNICKRDFQDLEEKIADKLAVAHKTQRQTWVFTAGLTIIWPYQLGE